MLARTFEFFLGGAWVDYTDRVRQTAPVKIKYGPGPESVKLRPATASLTMENQDDRFNPRNPMGPHYGHLIRNTPIRITVTEDGDDYGRFYGEIYAWKPKWNERRSDCRVPLECAGVLRRIIANDDQPRSAYRHWVNNHTGLPTPRYYWPLEEGGDAGQGRPDIGSASATWVTHALAERPSGKSWGAGVMNDWLPNGVSIQDLYGLTFPCDLRDSAATAWEVSFIVNSDSDLANAYMEIDCGTQQWGLIVSYVTNDMLVFKPDGTVYLPGTLVPGPWKEIGPLLVTFRVEIATGTLRFRAIAEPIGRDSDAVSIASDTVVGYPLVFPRNMILWNASNANARVTYSNVSVSESNSGVTNLNLPYRQTKGSAGETAYTRFDRLTEDQGVGSLFHFNGVGGVTMGRQYVDSFEDQLEELQTTAVGYIVESRTGPSLEFEGGSYMADYYDSDHTISIDRAELVGDISPIEDDKATANIVTVQNLNAGTALVTKPTGAMSIAEIGPFKSKVDTNSQYEARAVAAGQARLARGTNEAPRFESITVSAAGNRARYAEYLAVDTGWRLLLGGLAQDGYYDTLPLRVVAIEETLTQFDHLFTFIGVPANLDHWWALDGTAQNRTDMADCTTSALVLAGVSPIDVETPTCRWSTAGGDYPSDVMIAGERITVTAVSNVDANTQRLTCTRSVNGVAKDLPAGSTVELFPGNHIGVF